MADESASAASAKEMDAWVLATLPRALAFATSLVDNSAVADDLVHDCYCRLLSKSEVYDLPRDGTKLLYRAITNACINYARKRRFLSLDALAEQSGTLVDRKAEDPCQIVIQREFTQDMESAMRQLTIPQRAALELKSLGHSLQEIAEALETTPTNAGVLVHRARQTLARVLQLDEEKFA